MVTNAPHCHQAFWAMRVLGLISRLAIVLCLGLHTAMALDKNDGITSRTESIRDPHGKFLGVIRYHFDSSLASCNTVLLLGVGTFMSVSDYDKISRRVVASNPIVAIIFDSNVDHVSKTSSATYSVLANAVESQLSQIVSICGEGADFIFGGHSASGEAAVAAWQLGLFVPKNAVGFIGLDPYEISSKTIDEEMVLRLPSLFWGFSETTCLVSTDKAARAAYNLAEKNARVLYTIENEHRTGITHCVFTDHGCGIGPVGCAKIRKFEWITEMVAESIHRFIYAVQNPHQFRKSTFEWNHTTPNAVWLDVNQDERHHGKHPDF